MTSTYNRRKIKESLFVLRMLIIPLINLAVFFFYMNFDSVAMAFRIGDEPGLLCIISKFSLTSLRLRIPI